MPIAPGTGAANAPSPFGQQLQDARDSATRPSDVHSPAASETGEETASHPTVRRAAARSADKKDSKKDAQNGSGGAPATPAAAPPPLPFSVALPIAIVTPQSDNPSGDSRSAPGQASQMPDQAGGTGADATRQEAAPDPAAADTGTQPVPGDLTFALKLNSPAPTPGTNLQVSGPVQADAVAPSSVPPAATVQTQDQPQSSGGSGKESTQPAQDGISVRLNTISKEAAAAVAPVKEGHQSDADQDVAQSRPRNDMANAQTIAPSIAVKGGTAAPASPAASTGQAHPEAAVKTLDVTPIQGPASDQSGKPAGPLKELAIQVGQTSHDKVELRVVDRSGELQVAVRASNPDLAQGLRQGLSDLVDRLEQNGFRAEAWRPGATTNSVPGMADARQKPAQFQNDGGRQQSGGSQQGRQQNDQNQSRPRWVQELEGTLTGGQSSFQGESYGISRQ